MYAMYEQHSMFHVDVLVHNAAGDHILFGRRMMILPRILHLKDHGWVGISGVHRLFIPGCRVSIVVPIQTPLTIE